MLDLFLIKRPASLLKKEILVQLVFCGFCVILRTSFYIEHLWWLLLFSAQAANGDMKLKVCYMVGRFYCSNSKSMIATKVNSFQSSVVFHIETSHLICSPNQMTGVYMKCSTELKRVKSGELLVVNRLICIFKRF